MGYDLHITRAEHWSDEHADPISLDEWVAYVSSDPDMRLDGFAETNNATGETIRYENEGLAHWTAYSGHGAWFDYRDGRIVVKHPDEEIIRKMHAIASTFAARVQGDDGELYDEAGQQIPSVVGPRIFVPPSPSWWNRFLAIFRADRAGDARASDLEPDAPVVIFKASDRVKDLWENQGTILEADPAANHGLGRIRIRYDDGHEETVAYVASGLEHLTSATDDGKLTPVEWKERQ